MGAAQRCGKEVGESILHRFCPSSSEGITLLCRGWIYPLGTFILSSLSCVQVAVIAKGAPRSLDAAEKGHVFPGCPATVGAEAEPPHPFPQGAHPWSLGTRAACGTDDAGWGLGAFGHGPCRGCCPPLPAREMPLADAGSSLLELPSSLGPLPVPLIFGWAKQVQTAAPQLAG